MKIKDIAINKKDFEKYSICEIFKKPTYCITPTLEKFIKAWLRMQKKNRRRWGG